MSLRVAVVVATLLLGSSVGYFAWIARPQIFRQCTSPDGTWTVSVERAWRFGSIPVTVRASIENDPTSYARVIDDADVWTDPENRYGDVQCGNEISRVGPRYWDGEEHAYLVLRKNDLQRSLHENNVRTFGSPLIGELVSGITMADVLRVPSFMKLRWESRERERYQLDDGLEVVVVLAEAPGFVHLGHEGRLTLAFYNWRLGSAWFEPDDDASGYLLVLNEELGAKLPSEFRNGDTIVWASMDRGAVEGVGWRDERMRGEFEPYSD